MEKKLNVCIISIYFGKLPDWFDIWISTAIFNKDVDFLIVTDQTINYSYENIKVLNMTFFDFKKLAKEKLKYDIKLNSPYKLCDYKEVWGKILEDELQGYDYWGECDNDIVFGNLSRFFKKYNLTDYDKFGCRGHLTIYRNDENVMSRYKLNGGWFGSYKEVFKSNRIWAFDETPGINAIYDKHNFSSMNDIVFADIDVNYSDLRLVEFNELSPCNYDNQLFYWSNGGIYRAFYYDNKLNTDEFMYIHLQKRKMEKPDFNPFNVSSFIITDGQFINEKLPIDIRLINKYNSRSDKMRTEKKFGGSYKKDLRFYWLGRRFLNIEYDFKQLLKNTIIFKYLRKVRKK